ncbi:UPF0481 protein At3g47200-like [Coffea eugenioides]|uniref:UPF0481 protein At3g47200-like n=1 Tax=Coffea eugenioides TaxID=49369 RepID=UPI000F6124C6|nr:UPF0481 protein At3g47200-like [Coffea eugenioides]XP_027176069.1 UPF0481 protein At3g47200-like [Coffea eugenioides]
MQLSRSADVSITIQEKLKCVVASELGCNIFRIHSQLRKVNEKVYEPEIIAIGPYHRGKPDLSRMEEHKLVYLKSLLGQKIEKVATCVAAMKPLEEKARKCYAEPIALSSDEFVEMMLLDGCFIIQLLLKFKEKDLIDKTDPAFRLEWILNSLQRDLMLFENQLPFFILCKLYETIELPDQESGLIDLALNFFSDLLPGHGTARENGNPQDNIKHLLDLIHRNWSTSKLKPVKEMTRGTGDMALIRCSMELAETGIKLEKIAQEDIFDIEFENGTLRIPTLAIEERTESFLRNLVAYEQYCGDDQINLVTDYVTFLGCLIKSEKDVTKLSHHGIIDNFVGESEVISEMFNKMIVCIVGPSRNFHYAEIFSRVNIHCDRRMNRWWAKLRRNYCNSPWGIISIIAASLLLLLTLLQTIFSILSWKNQ